MYTLFINNSFFNYTDEISIDLDSNKAFSSNNIKTFIIDIDKIASFYPNIKILVAKPNIFKQTVLFAILNISMLIVAGVLYKKRITLQNLICSLVYDINTVKIIGKHTIAAFVFLAVSSILLKPGVDYESFSKSMYMFISGVDIYQCQYIAGDYIFNNEFPPFPYNPIMVIFYSFANILAFGYKPFYLHMKYELLSAILFKITNIILMEALTVSIIGFLLDYDIIKKDKAKNIFIWSMLNPLTFYISIIYIHLDILPIYCLSVGLMLLIKKNFKFENGIVAAVLIAAGVSCKMQNILLIPTTILFFFMIMIKEKCKKSICILGSLVLMIVNYIVMYSTNSLIGEFLSNLAITARVWFSVFALTQGVYIYLTMLGVIMLFIRNAFCINSKTELTHMLLNTFFMFGVIVMVFSGTMLSTLSTLTISFPAFVLLIALEDDWIKRIMIVGFSALCVFDVMFSREGDITAFLNYFDRPGFFQSLYLYFQDMPDDIKYKYVSILCTISKAAMLSYAGLFFNYSKKTIQKNI